MKKELDKKLEEGLEVGLESGCYQLGRAGGSKVPEQAGRRGASTCVVAALLATAGTVVLLSPVYMVMSGLDRQLGKGLKEATYRIETTWDGVPVLHTPVQISLGATESGDLTIDIQARLVGALPFPPDCHPGRPQPGLWNYEVVEAFFLDPVSVSYVELEFSPCGAHLALLLHPQRVDLVSYLPLQYTATVQGEAWQGRALVPAGYLPANVSSFNAFAIHQAIDAEDSQAWLDGKVYEALFPVVDGALEPDFHNLEVFGDIDLAELGVRVSPSPSHLWTAALQGKRFSGLL